MLGMDELDIRIVRELANSTGEGLIWGDLNPSYVSIATKLGHSAWTVRDRVEKLYKSGFLKGSPVQVNPHLLGLTMHGMSVDLPLSVSREDLVPKLASVEGVILVVTHVDGLVGLIVYCEDDSALKRRLDHVSAICGAPRVSHATIPFPPPTVRLSERDWQIVSRLQLGWPRRAAQVAAELGMSTKTLRRRMKRMADGMAISTIPSLDHEVLRGVVGNLLVEHSPGRDRRETDRQLTRQLEPWLLLSGHWSAFSLFTVVFPSIGEGSRLLEMSRRTKGVAGARLGLIERRVEVYSTLRERVERRMRDASAGPFTSSAPGRARAG
jgi:DNA-binding Lrp family transcriptional regulator